MARTLVFVILLFNWIVILNIQAFKNIIPGRYPFRHALQLSSTAPKQNLLVEANVKDMKRFGLLLANITDTIETAPEKALSMLSRDASWLLSHNLPNLAELLLATYPTLKTDEDIMKAYYFVIDFLDAFTQESKQIMQRNQKLLREFIEASKVSEKALDEFIQSNSEKVVNPEFLIYLDAEIAGRSPDAPMSNFLTSVKLRVLEEHGRLHGVNIQTLPILATETDPIVLKEKLWNHLKTLTPEGIRLLLHSMSLLVDQMKSKFAEKLDKQLLDNLEFIQILTEEYLVSMVQNNNKES